LTAADISDTVLEQRSGEPASAILEEVEAHRTRLIVTTTHGWSTDTSRPVGPVAEEILRRADCSLLLVRAEIARQYSEERRALARILIPLDGTPTTAAALAPAAEIASRSGAVLDILHVATAGQKVTEEGTMFVPQYEDNPYHEWKAWRDEFSTRFLGAFVGQKANLVVASGDPSLEILRVAREHQCDVIVVVWKGQLAVDRAQTVKAMLRDAPCPVLFLKTRPSLDLPAGVVDVRASPRM
jgi:nucleotide-binding universal stress UspA family protein